MTTTYKVHIYRKWGQEIENTPTFSKEEAAEIAKAAVEKLKAKGTRTSGDEVFVTWSRADGEKGFLNPDGRHSSYGREWE